MSEIRRVPPPPRLVLFSSVFLGQFASLLNILSLYLILIPASHFTGPVSGESTTVFNLPFVSAIKLEMVDYFYSLVVRTFIYYSLTESFIAMEKNVLRAGDMSG